MGNKKSSLKGKSKELRSDEANEDTSRESSRLLSSDARAAFNQLDTDNDGTLDMDEISMLFCTLGLELTDSELVEKFNSIDTDKNGQISFQEFRTSWQQIKKEAKDSLKTLGSTGNSRSNSSRRQVWENERHYHMERPSIVRHLFDAFAFHVPGAPQLSHLSVDGLYNLSRCLYLREIDRRKAKRAARDKPIPYLKKQMKPTMGLSNELLQLLDQDGNDRIEFKEFRDFLVDGAKMTGRARITIDDGNHTIMKFGLELVDNILEENHLMMEAALTEQYQRFDKDKSGTMSIDELVAWMVFIHRETGSPTPVPDTEIAETVVGYLDEDLSGSLERKEWMDWLREGHLTMLNPHKKRIYQSNGGVKAEIIVDFLDMVVLVASKRTKTMVGELYDAYQQISEEQESPESPKSEAAPLASQDQHRFVAEGKQIDQQVLADPPGVLTPTETEKSSLFRASSGSPDGARSGTSERGEESVIARQKSQRRRRRRHQHHHHHHHVDNDDEAEII